VFFLEGLPNLQMLEKLLIGEHAPEILQNDLELQSSIRGRLQAAIANCEQAADYGSRELLEEILEKTEAQIDWLESQLWLMENTGLENYLQSQV